eukprot:4758572-Karenia_brevis.AAC.1
MSSRASSAAQTSNASLAAARHGGSHASSSAARRRIALADALRTETANCWKKRALIEPAGSPVVSSAARAKRHKVAHPVGPQPPDGSATKGTKAAAAAPTAWKFSASAACLCGEDTAKSKAAAAP